MQKNAMIHLEDGNMLKFIGKTSMKMHDGQTDMPTDISENHQFGPGDVVVDADNKEFILMGDMKWQYLPNSLEERIRIAAEAYAKEVHENRLDQSEGFWNGFYKSEDIVEAFVDGAHSRDEEVENLQKTVDDLTATCCAMSDPWKPYVGQFDILNFPLAEQEYQPLSKEVLVRVQSGSWTRLVPAKYEYANKRWVVSIDGVLTEITNVMHWMDVPEPKEHVFGEETNQGAN